MAYVWILTQGERGEGVAIKAVFNRKPGIRALTSFTHCKEISKILKKHGVHTVGCDQYVLEKHTLYQCGTL